MKHDSCLMRSFHPRMTSLRHWQGNASARHRQVRHRQVRKASARARGREDYRRGWTTFASKDIDITHQHCWTMVQCGCDESKRWIYGSMDRRTRTNRRTKSRVDLEIYCRRLISFSNGVWNQWVSEGRVPYGSPHSQGWQQYKMGRSKPTNQCHVMGFDSRRVALPPE